MADAWLISIRNGAATRRRSAAIIIALGLAFTGSSAFASGNLLPAAHAGPDVSGSIGQTFSFSGSSSHDPDGTIVSYLWNFGDGATANGSSVTHAFSSVGTYTVTLTVTDNAGGTGTDTATAFVCPSIQSAINAAPTGSTVTLAACTYVETFTVNRPMTLRGGPGVVFDGGIGQPSPRNGPVATITGSNITLRDIEFARWNGYFMSAPYTSGLRLLNISATSASSLNLYRTINVLVDDSTLTGVTLYADQTSGLTLTDSVASRLNAWNSNNVRIDRSTLNSVSLSGGSGNVSRTTMIYVTASGPVVIEDSTVGHSTLSAGATLRTSRLTNTECCAPSSWTGPVLIERNVITAAYPLYIYGQSAVIRYNDFYSGSLQFHSSSQQSFIYLNNFYGGNVYDYGFDNRFDTGSLGNYWAGHNTTDANNDSILDDPRVIPGSANSVDRYPLATPFGGLPNPEERAADATAAPNALVDAARGVLIPMRGLEEGLTYDLTITNVTPSGAGFGYGYGGVSPYNVELWSPGRVLMASSTSYTDGLRSDRINVTYPAQTLGERGTWTIEYNGFPLASFAVSPPYQPPTSAPNPSGPSATPRVFDAQDQRFTFPAGARVSVGAPYDLTVTNITTPNASYNLHDPAGALAAGPANATEDGLHAGRLNATYADITFNASGQWTVRTPGGSVIASFEVDAPPGVNAFLADLTLTLGNRTDGATFGAATNASNGYDPGEDIVEPPAPADPTHVRLFFTGPPSAPELHRSTLYTNSSLAWPLVAQASNLNGTANLSWNSAQIASIDPTFSVELSDGNALTDMRTSTSHAFALGASHNLSVLVRQASGLRINASLVVLNETLRVGAGLYVSGSVINDGPHAATGITATLVIDNGTSITVNATPSTIVAGAFATFNFPPTVQTVPGGHSARISVNTTSLDTDPNNNAVTTSYFVTKSNLNLTVVGLPTAIVGLNGTANYTLRASNEGNVPENFTFSVTPPPPGWFTGLSASNLSLAPGENVTLVLTVRAPALATAPPIFTANVVGASTSDPSAQDQASLTTTVHVTHAFVVSDGWSLVSVPVVPENTSVTDVFGPSAIVLYGWNGTGYASTATVDPGRGYWLFSSGPAALNVTGIPLGNLSIPLQQGWNLVGSPIAGATLDNAPPNVARSAFTWESSGYVETASLAPGRAYWVNVHNGTATLPLGAAATIRIEPALWADEPEFVLRIGAEMGALRDAFRLTSAIGASTGVGPDDLQKAPQAPTTDQLRAAVVSAQNGVPVELHAAAEPPSEFHQWPIQIERSDPEETVTLRWDATTLATIPATYRVELQDGVIRVDMRAVDHHALVIAPGATTHAIRIIVADVLGGEVCVASLDGACIARSPVDPTRALALG